MAQQKFRLEGLLELPDLQAQGGLCDVELLRRLGDVPDLGDSDEIAKLTEIDRGLPGLSSWKVMMGCAGSDDKARLPASARAGASAPYVLAPRK